MKSEKIHDAIGEVRDEYIVDANKSPSDDRARWLRIAAVAAGILLAAAAAVFGIRGIIKSETVPISTELTEAAPVRPVFTASVNLLSGYSRQSTEEPGVSDALRDACSDFSFEMFRRISDSTEDGNVLVSPLSAYYCLALAANGADGETKAELEKTLGLSIADLNRQLYAYEKALPFSEKQKLTLANSLWFRDIDGLEMEEPYLQTLVDWYDTGVYAEPFDSETARRINEWCSNYTDGMIPEIMSGTPNEEDMIFLLNAVAFRSVWEKEYREDDIEEKTFRNADGSSKTVPMMQSWESVYLKDDSAIGVVRPYRYGEFLFAALLPLDDNADIYEFAASLTAEKWKNLWQNRVQGAEVRTTIPEFSAEEDYLLTDTVKAMGIRKLFSEDADLTKMAHSTAAPFCASAIRQKTYLKLNREGTEAAASTIINVTDAAIEYSEPAVRKVVKLDRPFVYLILCNDVPVFIGVTASLK